MSIESIVRPFQTPDASPARPYYVAGKAAPPLVFLQFGRGGGGKTFNGSQSASSTYYLSQYVNEKEDAGWGTAF